MKNLSIAIFLMLSLSSPTWAINVVVGQPLAAPTGGTRLVGYNSTCPVDTETPLDPNYAVAGQWTAVASGSIAKGYCRLRAYSTAGNAKMVVWLAADGSVVATSSATAITTSDSIYEFTFSSGSISSGTAYVVGYVSDVYTFSSYYDGETGVWVYSSNNYTTPTTVTISPSNSAESECYVTD